MLYRFCFFEMFVSLVPFRWTCSPDCFPGKICFKIRNLIVFSMTCLIPVQVILLVEILVKDIREFIIEFFIHKKYTCLIKYMSYTLSKLYFLKSGAKCLK